jgi:L-fuconate dehydratase
MPLNYVKLASAIKLVEAHDLRFTLAPGQGSDAVHTNPQYSFAVTRLHTGNGLSGTGLVLTMGLGNDLVCEAIRQYAERIQGREIEELMADFGHWFRDLADDPQLRWLGPHKGVVHLALASITNACFDLWAKSRDQPLWRLLLDLDAGAVLKLLDLSYLEDVLTPDEVLAILSDNHVSRHDREHILSKGYAGYDTSVGWFGYGDHVLAENARRALDLGFRAFKLKVGAVDSSSDIRRAKSLRALAGDNVRIMLDANQQWSLPKAIEVCRELAKISPYWIEEPTHPDDVLGHKIFADALAPIPLAIGEHVPNRVVFKNYLQAGCVGFVQADCTRVGGVSEFLTISLLARKFGVPVVPHVGDMGQIHQHLVLFNHIAMGHPEVFLEYIPHLREHFVFPAAVHGGSYQTPQEPGCSTDLIELTRGGAAK